MVVPCGTVARTPDHPLYLLGVGAPILGSKLVKNDKVCLIRILGPEFFNSGDKAESPPPPPSRRAAFFHRRFSSCIQGDNSGPTSRSCTRCFSDNFKSQ